MDKRQFLRRAAALAAHDRRWRKRRRSKPGTDDLGRTWPA
jgi:hypothetical protein